MATQATAPPPAHPGAPRSLRQGLPVRIGIGVAAAVLVLLALRSPVWESRLSAPQYPDGLRLSAYGDRIEGDLGEINSLNHYVGMPPFQEQQFPELELWVPVIIVSLVAVGAATAFGPRWPRLLALLFLWGVPLGALADIQYRLYHFGHDLDPTAAIRPDPFTPLVVGPTKVLNFTAWSYPGRAVVLLLVAAALLTFGPWLIERVARTIRS